MKLIPVSYFGFTAMDRRFSSPMLPWIVSEIRKRDFCEKLSLGIEDGVLQAYNQDFELQFQHKLWQVTRFSQADQDPTTFLYLMRDDNDTLLYCYLFQAKKSIDVLHVIDQVLDPMLDTPFSNPSAYDFLEQQHHWKLGSRKVSNFLRRVQFNNKQNLFKRGGGHTFFVPIDDSKYYQKLENIDGYVIEGHVVPNMVLFTRPAAKNFIYETAANGDVVKIFLLLESQYGRDFVKSMTILGNNEHKKGEILAEIVKANIPVTNGVVHLISQPLAVFDRNLKQFPNLPVHYKVVSDPFLETTHTMAQGRIMDILKKEKRMFTFFAPDNRAWTRYMGYYKRDLKDFLRRHLIVSDIRYTMLKLLSNSTTTLETLGGVFDVEVVYSNGSYFINWGQSSIRVLRPDFECSDGVVHVVDGVFAAPREATTTAAPPSAFWQTLKDLVT